MKNTLLLPDLCYFLDLKKKMIVFSSSILPTTELKANYIILWAQWTHRNIRWVEVYCYCYIQHYFLNYTLFKRRKKNTFFSSFVCNIFLIKLCVVETYYSAQFCFPLVQTNLFGWMPLRIKIMHKWEGVLYHPLYLWNVLSAVVCQVIFWRLYIKDCDKNVISYTIVLTVNWIVQSVFLLNI